MTSGMVSLTVLAALLGVARPVLLATFKRAGIGVSPEGRASESDLARLFGPEAARELIQRTKVNTGRARKEDTGC